MNVKIDHINLTTNNLANSIEWYKNLFDFRFLEGKLDDPKEPWAIVGKDDSALCLYEDKTLKPAQKNDAPFHRVYHFGIRVSDRAEWEKKLQEQNVKVLYGGAYEYPRSVSWYILDPSGHEIEVSYSNNLPLEFVISTT